MLNARTYITLLFHRLVELVTAIAKCQQAKILPTRARCSACLEMSRITVIYEKIF